MRGLAAFCEDKAGFFDNGVMRVAAIVFDFDGLLMDTESSMLASWQYEWRQHGLVLDLDTYWVEHGGDVTDHDSCCHQLNRQLTSRPSRDY